MSDMPLSWFDAIDLLLVQAEVEIAFAEAAQRDPLIAAEIRAFEAGEDR